MLKKIVITIGVLIVAVVLLIQLIPVDRTNPPVTREIQWDSLETEQLARRACYDCHSNETIWPWYAYVAPASLLVADHVDHGRGHLNFSEWDKPNEDADEIIEVIEKGEMPLTGYVRMHAEADLSPAEKEALINGLIATLENDPPIDD